MCPRNYPPIAPQLTDPQAIAACSPNAYFSALANPIIIGAILINFSGVVVPYSQIKAFWRYWLYYLNPFTYLMQGLLQPVVWDLEIECKPSELTDVPLPPSTSCGEYMAEFLGDNSGYVVDPEATASCEYCPYKTGADYLRTININGPEYGWRGVSFRTHCDVVAPANLSPRLALLPCSA